MRPLLERLALHRPELRARARYDWANSVYMTTVLATWFPIYFRTIACASLALTLSLTGSGRIVILATSVLFIAGGVVLSRVDVERGKEAARAAKGIS